MPKAILTFNLPKEQSEYNLATSAGKMHSALWEMYSQLRADSKYEEVPKYGDFYAKFYEILNEYGVNIHDVE